jgi:curved DNA-binding protein
MDYYSILGVQETASADEIKKAYKKLAMKHHPDRGGDTKTFQGITQAYETLSDSEKRSQYDAERKYGGTQFHFTSDQFDPFNQMFGGQNPFESFFRGGRSQRPRSRNRDLNIKCNITFKQSYTGTELEASYQLPTGKKQTVVIKVPAGIQSGQVIRYQSMGDDSIPELPRGDLMVTIIVEASRDYERRGDDLVSYLNLNPFEAMTGCSKIINLLDDSSVRINIHPGVQHGTEYLTKGKGFRNLAGYIGNLLIQIRIVIPTIQDEVYKKKLMDLYAEISETSKPNT